MIKFKCQYIGKWSRCDWFVDSASCYFAWHWYQNFIDFVVEDTNTTIQELEDRFGSVVSSIVAECTDDKSLPKETRKQLQIEHAANASIAAKHVKLADKLYNLRDLERAAPVGWSSDRIREYFLWAEKVIAGCVGTCPTLEAKLNELVQDAKNKY